MTLWFILVPRESSSAPARNFSRVVLVVISSYEFHTWNRYAQVILNYLIPPSIYVDGNYGQLYLCIKLLPMECRTHVDYIGDFCITKCSEEIRSLSCSLTQHVATCGERSSHTVQLRSQDEECISLSRGPNSVSRSESSHNLYENA